MTLFSNAFSSSKLLQLRQMNEENIEKYTHRVRERVRVSVCGCVRERERERGR